MSKEVTFLVWCPDYGETEDDARAIESDYDDRDVVIGWAERSDYRSAEYHIAKGNTVTVHVRTPEGKLSRFEVSGESIPQYHARRLADEPSSAQETIAAGGKERG